MWILTLSDLSGEIRAYEGTLDECLLNAILYNENHKNKKHAGCFMLVKQYSYLPRE
jgi:hypothetical protein